MKSFRSIQLMAALLALNTVSNAAIADDRSSSGISTKEYGRLYIAEEKDRQIYSWRASLNTNYEFGNPYSNVYGIQQNIERSVGEFLWVGLQATEYLSSNTYLMGVLQDELKGKEFGLRTEKPKFSVAATTTLVPLRGHWSIFGENPLVSELGVRMGVGTISYTGENPRLLLSWSLRPTIYVSSKVNVQLGFGQDIESLFIANDRVARFKGDLGIGFQF